MSPDANEGLVERILRLRRELAAAEAELTATVGPRSDARMATVASVAAGRGRRPDGLLRRAFVLLQLEPLTFRRLAQATGYPEHSCAAALSKLASSGLAVRFGPQYRKREEVAHVGG